jgi:flagellar hook-associated protein 1 FlgK
MLQAINVSSSGLAAAREQVENVMNNIANQSTEGYKRRRVNISESSFDARKTGRGVNVGETNRVTNEYMRRNLIQATTKQSQLDELSNMLASVESIFKETKDSGLSADLDRYFQSIEDLRANPSSEIYKTGLRKSGKILVDNLKNLYKNLEQREKDIKESMKSDIVEINSILVDIDKINAKVENHEATNELLDKRDLLEKKLATYVDVEVSHHPEYLITINNRTAVRHGHNVRELFLNVTEVAQKDIYAQDDADVGHRINNLVKPTWGKGDSVVYRLDNDHQVSVTYGEELFAYNIDNERIDLDGNRVLAGNKLEDGSPANVKVTKDNIIKALAHKINQDKEISKNVTAYNGQYEVDKFGEKILTNDSKHSGYVNRVRDATLPGASSPMPRLDYDFANINKTSDTSLEFNQKLNAEKYLMIESNTKGDVGQFTGRIIVYDNNSDKLPADWKDGTGDKAIQDKYPEKQMLDILNEGYEVDKNTLMSKDATDTVQLRIFDRDLSIKSGSLKSKVDNQTTKSGNNFFSMYKKKLDSFVSSLVNITKSYIPQENNQKQPYVYGERDSNLSQNRHRKIEIGLFSGSDVDSLKFNANSVDGLKQDKLDYLVKTQWKTDFEFGEGKDKKVSSITQFYQSIRVTISDDKENTDFQQTTQDSVTKSMSLSYDKLTKVDKDEELMMLMKFQAAFQANAKLITVIDEMLNTILGLKR